MTDADLKLPAELVPGDGRFGSGPSKVRDESVGALSAVAHGYLGTSHRRDGVKRVVHSVRDGLSELFGLPDGYEVLLGLGGSTVFWDAASFGLIDQSSTHLVLGEFSSKFAAVTKAAPHLEFPAADRTTASPAPGLCQGRNSEATSRAAGSNITTQ